MVGGQAAVSLTLPHAYDQGFRPPHLLAHSQRPTENGVLQATDCAPRAACVPGKLLYRGGAEYFFHVDSAVYREGRFVSGRESA